MIMMIFFFFWKMIFLPKNDIKKYYKLEDILIIFCKIKLYDKVSIITYSFNGQIHNKEPFEKNKN